MTQYQNVTIDPTVTNGSQLASNINSWREATLSLHSGVARPAYATAGTMWLSTASTPWKLYVFDGVNDAPLGEIDPAGHAFVSAGGTDFTNDLMTAADPAAARDKLGAVSRGGDTMTGELVSTSYNVLRMVAGDYGAFFWSGDGVITLLITDFEDPYGGYNDYRPFTVNLATGAVDIRNLTIGQGDLTVEEGNLTVREGGLTVKKGDLRAGDARFETNGNSVGSIWNNWGAGDAHTAINNRIEDRAAAHANSRAAAGATCVYNSDVVEFGVAKLGDTKVVDAPTNYVLVGLRGHRTIDNIFYQRARLMRNQ
ncbi:UNVERIFIED_ORG: hypothetical protein BCL66_105147 [Martelella mediterranea]